ncbi:hypothetical protein EHO98_15665 [Leptospira stimsonii]|uniref:DUF1564 domain-containing protein n=1 Tax=Leptospira stimsonii TaxID=2202203 RepID=A0ABY2MYD0_9LEPT|nr:hypothetical protein EHO98_15665 [Leptospira stimsonii]TGM11686.1 hypothetical protein EHQ90_15840 [Leptospira stimsonii]
MITGSAVVLIYIRNFSRHRLRFSWGWSPGRLKNRFQDQFSNHSLDGNSFSLVLFASDSTYRRILNKSQLRLYSKEGKLWTINKFRATLPGKNF